jgi:hypothetical protein
MPVWLQVMIGVSPLCVIMIGGILHLHRVLSLIAIEHEILVRDYCKRNSIPVEDFPTRVKGLI